ncbi:MAG: hypothetical protein NUW08_01650 [Candidatus Uhrbacteria bacterium]|nr:hypothetical protein [Candidatus Uhrbacteria bacterium]
MTDTDPDTLRPETLEVVPICIIDADPQFAKHLSRILTQRLANQVYIAGTYDGIPRIEEIGDRLPDVVIFDPELDDFRRMREAVTRLRAMFGSGVKLVAHSDLWKVAFNRLRLELIDAEVRLGLGRYDYKAAIELISYVSGRLPLETLIKRFGI